MKHKPNFRPRTAKQFKENAMHVHCERRHQILTNPMNHIHLVRSVFVIATTAVLLLLPAIVKCDNNVLNEVDNGGEVHAKNTLTELSGGRIIGEKWLRHIESPYSLQMDMTIERSGKLFIEPGVTIHVAPMVGITVRGVLTALVSAMTSWFFLLFIVNKEIMMKHPIQSFRCLAHSFKITSVVDIIVHISFLIFVYNFFFAPSVALYNGADLLHLILHHKAE